MFSDIEYSDLDDEILNLNISKDNSDNKLFYKSQVTLKEFNTLFMSLISKINLPETHSEILFEFIRVILPADNLLAETFYRFKKCFNFNIPKEKRLCSICKRELKDNKCPCSTCVSIRFTKKEAIRRSIKIVSVGIRPILINILNNHYDKMIRYKSK